MDPPADEGQRQAYERAVACYPKGDIHKDLQPDGKHTMHYGIPISEEILNLIADGFKLKSRFGGPGFQRFRQLSRKLRKASGVKAIEIKVVMAKERLDLMWMVVVAVNTKESLENIAPAGKIERLRACLPPPPVTMELGWFERMCQH